MRVGSWGTRTIYSADTQYLPDGSQTVTLTTYANIVASTNYDYTFAGTTQQVSDGASAKLLVEKTPGVWTEAGSGTVNANAFSFKARLTGNGAQNFKVVITDGASEISTKTYAVTVYDPIVAATATVATKRQFCSIHQDQRHNAEHPGRDGRNRPDQDSGTDGVHQRRNRDSWGRWQDRVHRRDCRLVGPVQRRHVHDPDHHSTACERTRHLHLAGGSVQVPVGTVTVTPSVASNASNNRYLRVNATTQFVPAGTVATVQVKAPGQSTFTDLKHRHRGCQREDRLHHRERCHADRV